MLYGVEYRLNYEGNDTDFQLDKNGYLYDSIYTFFRQFDVLL